MNNTNIEEKKHSKKVLVFIIITIILLLFFTSCGYTSKFLGKLGQSLSDSINGLFNNQGDYKVDENVNDKETVINQELTFDMSEVELSLEDKNVKLSYSYKSINPSTFTCSTGDPSIATCYVNDGYVVVNPKAVGTTTVTIQTVANGKIYEATTQVKVNDFTRQILLSSQGGTINLRYGSQISIPFQLIGLEGEVVVSSSNPSVATATVTNGTVQIKALRSGTATITLSVLYNGTEYTATYVVRVVERNNEETPGGNNPGGNNPGGNNPEENNPSEIIPVEKEYQLSSYQSQYDMNFINDNGERIVILNTNLFASQNVVVTKSENKKQIKICSSNNENCVYLDVNANLDGAGISLDYIGDTESPNSLPFKISAKKAGTSIVHVVGMVNGKSIADFDIKIVVDKKYQITIYANGGIFNEFASVLEFQLGYDEILDLSKYDEPYKTSEDACSYYQFIGYSETENGTITYNRLDKNILTNFSHDVALYAIYSEDAKKMIEKPQEKTLWAVDIPLFHNEEYYQKHKEDKVIYPGAKGSYVMNIKNEGTEKITLTGMTLKENTICIAGKGCLNMGYMVRYSPESNDTTYYYGNTNEEYWILHNKNSVALSDQTYRADISFNDKKIEIEPGQEIALTLFWKWEELDDELDTLIGNQAAGKLIDSSLNDKYNLSVGIHFETQNKTCVD